MPDDRPPERGPREAPTAQPGPTATGPATAAGLVWPPTEAELDAWEVVELHDPARPASPGTAPSAPGASAVVPTAASSAPAVPAPASAAQDAVVVRAAPRSLTGPGPERSTPADSPVRREPGGPAERVRIQPAAPRSAMAILIVVPLLAVLSAAAGFIAALWLGPKLVPSSTLPPTLLIVESREPGAQVLVNGEPRGTTPLRLSMKSGETRIEVQPPSGPTGSTGGAKRTIAPTAGVLRGSSRGGATGSVLVRSTPPGARVVLMGRMRGVTPLSIAGIPVGLHEVEIDGGSGAIGRRVEVRAGRLSTLDVDLRGGSAGPEPSQTTASPAQAPVQGPGGYLTVRSRIPLQILERGRVVGLSTTPRIGLSPGVHDLQLVAAPFEFETSHRVEVRAGRTSVLAIDLPNGRASFNAEPWAEVWLQGNRLGETPLGNVALPIGVHEVVFRHPQMAERRETITVRASTPTRISVRLAP